MDTFDISEVARRTGLTTRALRFYETRGLVRPLRTAAGRRHYGAGELARLHAVVALKRAGLPLARIGEVLGARSIDLAALVAAQLAEVEARAAALAQTRALLSELERRLVLGEPLDLSTLCTLINEGDTMQQDWTAISNRYLSAQGEADFADAARALPSTFDQNAYAAAWSDLSARIAAALPLDPASPDAQALLAEWQALLAPFTAVATPAMTAGVSAMYDDMASWQSDQTPPFAPEVWSFIRAASAAAHG
ncbi:MerR family transcriptional regulator [uncultured Sphingomonas sp.]|uniref:MerR family transcriptional regulator n=1 Tax=uncultured Sphingomonas sp. TaxID=158754 RepID=UPI00261DDC22|nr:MerR family transcriptional regulator [uncultured Sphingomonas sp.]